MYRQTLSNIKDLSDNLQQTQHLIFCLHTTYKLLTEIIVDSIYYHLERASYLEEDLNGHIS